MDLSVKVVSKVNSKTLVFSKIIFRSHGRYVPKVLCELRRIFDIAHLSYYVLSPRYSKDNYYRIIIATTISNLAATTLSLYFTSHKFTHIQTSYNPYINNPSIYGLCLSSQETLVEDYRVVSPIPHLICPPRGMLKVDPGSPSSLCSQGRTVIKINSFKNTMINELDEL